MAGRSCLRTASAQASSSVRIRVSSLSVVEEISELSQCPRREQAGERTLTGARQSLEPHPHDGALLELEGLGASVAAQAERQQAAEVGLMADDSDTVGLCATAPQDLEHLFRRSVRRKRCALGRF